MANPLITRRRLLFGIIETTEGTAETVPTAPLTVMDVANVSLQRGTPFIERDGGHYGFGPQRGTVGIPQATVSFQTHLYGTASSAWAALLLPACGLSLVTGGYKPSSLPPAASGSPTKTATFYVSEDGRRHVVKGCMGTFRLSGTAGQRVVIDWTFTGIYDQPTDVALPTYSAPSALPITFKGAATTIGAFTPKLAEFTLDIGNTVVLREDAVNANGAIHAAIVNRRITGTMVQESELVGTYDPEDDFRDSTVRALSVQFGGSGNQVDIDIPDMQVTGVQSTDRNGILMDTVSWQACRDDATGEGDDEITIALS